MKKEPINNKGQELENEIRQLKQQLSLQTSILDAVIEDLSGIIIYTLKALHRHRLLEVSTSQNLLRI